MADYNLSVSEVIDIAAKYGTSGHPSGEWVSERHEWALGISPEKSRKLGVTGLHESVEGCEALIDKVTPTLLAEHEVQTGVWGVTGSIFDNAALIAGLPDYAMDFEQRPETLQAVKVVINHYYSCGVPAEKLARRARAITALLATLNAIGHPVELVLSSGFIYNGAYNMTVTVHRAGEVFDLARIAYWAGHPAAVRQVVYPAMSVLAGKSGLGFSRISHEFDSKNRAECGKNGWLYIEAAHLDMVGGKYDTDEQAAHWVATQVNQLGAYNG